MEGMSGPLDRIEKMMRLALHNPNEEEARSAAMKCLQLMAEHNATITLPVSAQPKQASQSNVTYDMLRDLMRQQQQAQPQNSYGYGYGYNYGRNPFGK